MFIIISAQHTLEFSSDNENKMVFYLKFHETTKPYKADNWPNQEVL